MISLSTTVRWITGYTEVVLHIKQLWCHTWTLRNGNIVQLNSAIFWFCTGKHILGTCGRKITTLYCSVVTKISTDPYVESSCPCLSKRQHGIKEFDTQASWFISHYWKIDDSIDLQWWFVNPGSNSPEISLVRTKSVEPISTSGLMGDSVIRKTR